MKHGEFENVELSDAEFHKLELRFGLEESWRQIEALSIYMAAKPTKYKSHYAVILMWARQEGRGATRPRFTLTDEELKEQREKEHTRMFGGLST